MNETKIANNNKKPTRKRRSKKKATPVPSARQVRDLPELEGPVLDDDGAKCLHKYDMLRLELAQEKVKVAAGDVAILEREAARLQLEYDKKLSGVLAKLTAAKASAQTPTKHLLALRGQIGEVYGIKLDLVTYDDISGRLTLDTADGLVPVT